MKDERRQRNPHFLSGGEKKISGPMNFLLD